ncbi:ABC transporter substrate-binding protein [Streptomyces triticisoli]|uniref:ABC transporter substrate-binding protein n=1 Tax=Streptomyces triticisoli TaxID=2182797 RepID=UPI001E644059|nr:ABC transporter substrate-binding protein [Streptomyces triticisoli]
MRILTALLVVAVVGVGGWQLLPSEEKKNKTITVGTTDAATSLDPAAAYDAGSWTLLNNVFQSLLTFQPGGTSPVPDAASSCDFVDGGLRTYRCEVRDDITFPSGRTMTAEDVKFSFDRVKKINSDVGPAPLLSTLDSVEAVGSTVTFHLSSPDATFPQKVATGAGAIVDHTRYAKDALRTGTQVDGTGPYRLKEYAKDKRAVLEPNGSYKGAVTDTGRPIELRYYGTPAELDRAWQDRQIDVASRTLPPKVLAGLNPSDPGHRVSVSSSPEVRNLYLNTRASSSLHDVRVRRAVAMLINREHLAGAVYDNTVDALYSLVPTGITGHTTAFFDAYPEQDVKRARALLTEAGVSIPMRFTYGYGKRGVAAEEAAELKRQLEESGLFKVDVKGYEWADFQKRWVGGKLDAYAVGWVADYPDPDTFGSGLVGTGSVMNTGYSSKTVDNLIRATQEHSDRGRVVADFRTLQAEIATDVPLIPLWQRKDYVISSEDVGGGQYLTDGSGAFRLWKLDWI